MQSDTQPIRETGWFPKAFHEPLFIGTICGLMSAVGYTAANICLRAVSDCDAMWVSTVKAAPTVVMFGPWLLLGWWRFGVPRPAWRPLGILVGAALFCQLFGNVAFQIALGYIGIALVVPLTLGTMIITGALLGRIFLHEAVTPRAVASIMTLVVAICVLSLGADEASATVRSADSHATIGVVATGVGMACISGLAYSVLGVVIRYSVTGKISIAATIVVVTLTGVVTLGAFSLRTIGWSGILATDGRDFATMALAGVFNAVAFVALTKSLQLVPLVYVNALNATQATMAALAGVILFAESQSAALWFGVGLTVVGLMLMQQRRSKLSSRTKPPTDLHHGWPRTCRGGNHDESGDRPCAAATGTATSGSIDGS